MPTYYLNNKCDFCEFKPYVKCEANGYHTKEIKSHFEQQQDLQKEIDKLEESAKQTKNKNKNTEEKKMTQITVMVVPGKIARVELVVGMTVLMACEQAERQIPGVNWVELAKSREVRVQNRKFSNTDEVVSGTFGSISRTPLNDGEVVLILSKIKGNEPGLGALTCMIDGQEFALETPGEIGQILSDVAGYDLSQIRAIFVNGEESPFDQLIGNGDNITVEFVKADSDEHYDDDAEQQQEEVTVTINGHVVTGRPEDIRKILQS